MMVLPSLYALHLAPQMIGTLTIHLGLAQKIAAGVDLFMPGIVTVSGPVLCVATTFHRNIPPLCFPGFAHGDAMLEPSLKA
jgi:hypothetical protein